MMQKYRFQDIKLATFVAGGVIMTFALYLRFVKTGDLTAPGDAPPTTLLLKNLPWLLSEGPIGGNGYALLIMNWFERQNQKSFWVRTPGHRLLNTVDPVVLKEVFSCPYKWTKSPGVINILYDFLGDGIFNSNGIKWRIQRKQASYLFSEANLKEVMFPVMKKQSDKLISWLTSKAAEGPCEMQKAFHDVFMDTFSEVAFGWSSNSFDSDSKFGQNYDQITNLLMTSRAGNPVWKLNRWLNIGKERELSDRLKRHKEVIRNVVKAAIENKKAQSDQRAKNLISRLLDISAKGERLTVQTMVDFVTNFILAGRDTTALTMTWSLYNLVCFPETRQKLLDDINRAITAYPDDLWSQLKEMVYVEAWIYESLRFHTPVPAIGKCSTDPIVLKDGSIVPKKSNIIVRIQASSWNPNIWENPRTFSPERHLKNGKLNIKPPEEFPIFNGGKRLCLGKRMAITNAKLMLTELVKRFEFSICRDKPAPKQTWRFTSKSSTGMWMNVKIAAPH